MRIAALILSITSGFALMRYALPPLTIAMTSIAVDLALAPITAIIAHRRGRSAMFWSAIGVAFGLWALAYVLLVPWRRADSINPGNGRPSQAA
jgi:hypothetical protein